MQDLKKVEQKFHEYLKARLNEEIYRIDEIKITEELLEKEAAFYIPFGWISYFLVIEDENPVIYVNVATRMDTDSICFVDEEGYKCYDVFFGDHKDISEKYYSQLRKVKRYSDIKDIHF